MSGEVLPNLLVKGTGLVAARYGTEITLRFSFSGGGVFFLLPRLAGGLEYRTWYCVILRSWGRVLCCTGRYVCMYVCMFVYV